MAAKDGLVEEAHIIRDRLKKGDPRTPTFNILLMGSEGSGKSSLINSLITAVDHTGYREHSVVGAGGTEGSTAVTPGCKKIKMFEDKGQYTTEEQEFRCRPVFWDFPGLVDDNEEELLKLLLKGQIEPNTSLGEIRALTTGVWGYLKRLTLKENVDDKMHLLLFVQSAVHYPPKHLIQSIMGTIRTVVSLEYETPCILVLTHADKERPNEGETVEDKLRNTARRVAKLLKMENVWERIFIVSCYASETAGDNEGRIHRKEEIDKMMCKIWNTIIQRQYYADFRRK